MKQLAGSALANSVAEALVRSENFDSHEGYPMDTPTTFGRLAEAVSDILVKGVDTPTLTGYPSFAAQDDLWDDDSRSKSGFPLSTFKERYDSLQIVQQMQTGNGSEVFPTTSAGGLHPSEPMGNISKALEENESVKMSRFLQLPIGEAVPRIKSLATLYMATTFSDDQELAKNIHVHNACGRLIEGNTLLSGELESLASSLEYRMFSIISQANRCKVALGPVLQNFPWCHEINAIRMISLISREKDVKARYSEISSMVNKKGVLLFDRPGKGSGHVYNRGTVYLTLALQSTIWTNEIIKLVLEELVQIKRESSVIDHTIRSLKLSENSIVKQLLDEMAQCYSHGPDGDSD